MVQYFVVKVTGTLRQAKTEVKRYDQLYGVMLSPFVRKAMLALEYKGIKYENVSVFPGADDPEFRAISPLGKVPVLTHDDFSVPDTSVICRYLDRVFPEKPIYPTDAKEEARACWLEEYGDSKLIEACAGLFQQRFLFPRMFNQETDEGVVSDILENRLPPFLDYLESQVPESGPLVGDSVSVADLSILTCFLQAKYGDFEVSEAKHPKLKAYLDAAMENDIVKARIAAEEEFVKAMSS